MATLTLLPLPKRSHTNSKEFIQKSGCSSKGVDLYAHNDDNNLYVSKGGDKENANTNANDNVAAQCKPATLCVGSMRIHEEMGRAS